MTPQTLYDKRWDSRAVHVEDDGTTLPYMDRHVMHEVTSTQAFEGPKLARRKLWSASANLATADQDVPATDRPLGISDPVSRLQVDTLDANCKEFGIVRYSLNRDALADRVETAVRGVTVPATCARKELGRQGQRKWAAPSWQRSET